MFKSALTLLIFVAGVTGSAAQNTSSLQRGIFYETRPFGALAFIGGVYSQDAAEAAFRVLDLSQSQCVQLPVQSEYWFLINHQNKVQAGQAGFFGVKIFARGPSDEATDDLRIHRSPGFVDSNGRQLPQITGDPSTLSIGAKAFTALHDESAIDEQARLKSLAKGLRGEWHASPDRSIPNTWTNRRIFADRRLTETGPNEKLILGARLVRFTATASTISMRPMVFGFNPSGMKSFRISVSAPGFDLFNQTTELRVGIPCEQSSSRSFFSRLFGN